MRFEPSFCVEITLSDGKSECSLTYSCQNYKWRYHLWLDLCYYFRETLTLRIKFRNGIWALSQRKLHERAGLKVTNDGIPKIAAKFQSCKGKHIQKVNDVFCSGPSIILKLVLVPTRQLFFASNIVQLASRFFSSFFIEIKQCFSFTSSPRSSERNILGVYGPVTSFLIPLFILHDSFVTSMA